MAVDANDSWEQIGVVSYGYECGVADVPGVYTRVSGKKDYKFWNIFIIQKLQTESWKYPAFCHLRFSNKCLVSNP